MTDYKYDTAAPYIASYVLLRRDNTIAFVLRRNTQWMDGYYSLPSGKVEKMEAFSAGAIREAKEEVGVTIAPEDLRPVLTMHREGGDTQWVDVYFEVDKWEGEPVNAEPHVHSELAWLDLDNLPENVIPSVVVALEHIKAGTHFAELGWPN
ncbi:MAG: mismatch repair protein MutT [Candidatus Saccharibacteria bacterium]|nr:mismatch repair protein MutT [Candidatus Saccharibacteria bacterium]